MPVRPDAQSMYETLILEALTDCPAHMTEEEALDFADSIGERHGVRSEVRGQIKARIKIALGKGDELDEEIAIGKIRILK